MFVVDWKELQRQVWGLGSFLGCHAMLLSVGSRTGMGSWTFTGLSRHATEFGSRPGMGSRTFSGLSRNATE